MARKRKPEPKQHFPTAAERDEKTRIDAEPEEALKILLGAVDDRELDGERAPKPRASETGTE